MMSGKALEGLTVKNYMEMWVRLKSKQKMADELFVGIATLYRWETKNKVNKLISKLIKEKHHEELLQKIKRNNEMKEEGCHPVDIAKELGYSTVESYYTFRWKTKQKGYDVL